MGGLYLSRITRTGKHLNIQSGRRKPLAFERDETMNTHLKFHRIVSLLVMSTLLAMTGLGAAPVTVAMSRVIVQGTSLDQAVAAVLANQGHVTANIDIIKSVVADVPRANLEQLTKAPGVVRVTLDRAVQISAALDSKKDDQGKAIFEFSKAIGAKEVWDTGNLGQGITVAFLDSGIDPTLNSLQKGPKKGPDDRFLIYYDAIGDKVYEPHKLNKSPGDPNGHGTHVAGIVGNSDKEEDFYQGIAPAANLVAVRVLDETGMGTYADVLRGLNWVVLNKATYNIRVLNVSMYATPVAPYWADPYNLAVMAAWQAGIVVVASAGNGGPAPLSIGVPGNTPYIITVGAFTDNYTPNDLGDDYMPPFSASGPTLDAFVKPDLIAPGAHIPSLMKNNTYVAQEYPENRVKGHYFKMSGTSMSAAIVSGIVALMLEAHPELTPDQVKYRLTMTARPQFSEYSGEAAYTLWQQGAGRVWAPDAVSTDVQGTANQGMDIAADLAGTAHYQGWSVYDPVTAKFTVNGDGYTSWSGGYASWSGGYTSWSGGYTSWSGGTTNWSGDYNSWLDGYASWSGGYTSWSGGYTSWSGGYTSWSGGYTSWSGGYTSWSGGYTSWSGGYTSWSGSVGDPTWAATFVGLLNLPDATSSVGINNWVDGD
jgi:serine protease AprX